MPSFPVERRYPAVFGLFITFEGNAHNPYTCIFCLDVSFQPWKVWWLWGISHRSNQDISFQGSFLLIASTLKMPVTRSQSQNLTNQRSISAQGNTEVSSRSVEQEQAARGAFIEWLILDYSSNSILNRPIGSLFLRIFTESMAVAKLHLHVPWRIPRDYGL